MEEHDERKRQQLIEDLLKTPMAEAKLRIDLREGKIQVEPTRDDLEAWIEALPERQGSHYRSRSFRKSKGDVDFLYFCYKRKGN